MTKFLAATLALAAFGSFLPAAEAAPVVTKPYTLTTCIVSGDKLGEMGAPVVVTREGREIKFCCKGCIKDFDKAPAKFLKKIEEAEAKVGKPAATDHGHPHH